MSEHEAGGDRPFGIEQIGEFPRRDSARMSGMDRVRILQNRPLELDQPGPIAGRRLGAELFGDRGRGAAGETKIPMATMS